LDLGFFQLREHGQGKDLPGGFGGLREVTLRVVEAPVGFQVREGCGVVDAG
jgi:hypothetical protein